MNELLRATILASLLAAATWGFAAAVRAASTMPGPVPVEVSMFEERGGYIFANNIGQPFFTNDRDPVGKIGCDDACLGESWQPVWSQTTSTALPNWSLVARDGYRQWAYKGKAIYSYVGTHATSADEVRAMAKADGHFHEVKP